jgi:Flp pilus assembly protein TadD
MAQYRTALELRPEYADARNNLAIAYLADGRVREAVAEYRAALALAPDSTTILDNLAAVLASGPEPAVRDGAEAVTLARRAAGLSGDADPALLRTLAMAYAATGRFEDAERTAEQAAALAAATGRAALADQLAGHVRRYREHRPLDAPPRDP